MKASEAGLSEGECKEVSEVEVSEGKRRQVRVGKIKCMQVDAGEVKWK